MAGNNHLRAKQTGHRYLGNTECDFFLLAPLKMKKKNSQQLMMSVMSKALSWNP